MSENKTGSYSVVQPTIYDYARALIAEKERSDAIEAQNKALTAKRDEALTAERDEAIRTKTQYQSNLASQMFGLTLRTFGTKKGVKDLNQIRLMVNDDAMRKLKCASFEARCPVGELCNAIIMQWLGEHEAEIKKD